MNRLVTNLYFAAPVWAQELCVSAYGLHLRHLRYGQVQQRILATLRDSEWMSREELELLQLGALNRLVAEARADVPYYRGRLPEMSLRTLADIRSLPIMSKADIRSAGRNLVSRTYAHKRLRVVHTGGTTGTPLSIYCTRDVLQANYAFFGRFREWASVPIGARVATFAGRTVVPPQQERPPFWRFNRAANTLLCSSYHLSPASIPEYVDALASFGPTLIDSYPSSLVPIAQYIRHRNLTSIRPRAVITSSETLEPEARRLIAEAFGCPVFDHYGAAEMAAFITQCALGAYHVNPEYGIVEVLRDGVPAGPGEAGEIVATGFINPVMPLIRYATGDIAVLGTGLCACGRKSPIIQRIEGRADDVLVTPEGRLVGRLDPIFKAVASLVETRIVQDRLNHVRVEFVADGTVDASETAALVAELRNRLGPSMQIDIVRVPRLLRSPSGKLRAVVNLVGSPGGLPELDAAESPLRPI